MGVASSSSDLSDDDTYRLVPWKNLPTLSRPQPNSERIKAYYTTYKGLSNGSGSRRALPTELVLYICCLAGFEIWSTTRAPEGHKRIRASSAQAQSLVWFQTEPFTRQMLRHTKSVQLVTISRYRGQGKVRRGSSRSWFELQVARPTEQDSSGVGVKRRPDGNEVSWPCLIHTIGRKKTQVQTQYAQHKGDVLDSEHEIWNHIEEGDVLQVVMKAQFPGWLNAAADGILRISTWWEPSAEMLDLMEQNNSDNQRE
ncbi:hypothetical protein OPQ81_004913 [Rhizoctonia solani]|nr:hypothetical protein OPQ81_004913 [Rhizoctonia solani]